MRKPKMVLFDYGHTLLYEPDFDIMRGQRAVFEYVTENPHGVTPEEVQEFATRLFAEVEELRKRGFELGIQLTRTEYEHFGLKFSKPLEEIERILWWVTSEGATMPNVEPMLAFLKQSGIRTGVISNLGWSGGALVDRIDTLLPENDFEFIMASSEYGIRKPNPLLFGIALEKAGLPPEDVWYCGDSVTNDVRGAHAAGMFPVLYSCPTVERSVWNTDDPDPQLDFEFLHICDWNELVEVIKSL